MASFQAGMLYELRDLATGQTLLSLEPSELPAHVPLFDSGTVDLDSCGVSQRVTATTVACRVQSSDGVLWVLRWTIEPGNGDLVLRMQASTPEPVEDFHAIIPRCNIEDFHLVTVDQLGVGAVHRSPFTGIDGGEPGKDSPSRGLVRPLVALFAGTDSGWFVEGRDLRTGPSGVMLHGRGARVDLGFVRSFPVPTRTPELFEIRVRSYRGQWHNGADPYVAWMESGLGFIPLDQQSPAWVKDIANQAYVRVGDFETLDSLARQVDPTRTLVGRMVGFRDHPMGSRYPDYRLTGVARRWFQRARQLGFHVGAHFSYNAVSAHLPHMPDLAERMRPGFKAVGTDPAGNELYEALPEPAPLIADRTKCSDFYRCSAAYQPWRETFIETLREAVEAGVDVIYLDESAWPVGKYLVDGVTAVEGVMALGKEIRETYPDVAIETEQFNTMANRHAALALTQMNIGHPLGGYLFHRFVKIVPEGIVTNPTDTPLMDAFQSAGFITISGAREPSWIEMARAFQDYQLVPDITMPRCEFYDYVRDRAGGLMPAPHSHDSGTVCRLFGYRGQGGVTAYFEKHPMKRGLVIYEEGKDPRWVGTRVSGVRTWTGPGVLREWLPGREAEIDWFLYHGDTQLGLNPETTYRHDPEGALPADRFHVTTIPDNFSLPYEQPSYVRPQDVGSMGSFYRLLFQANGELGMHVPEHVLVFLDGREIPVDRAARTARVEVTAAEGTSSEILAFVTSETVLSGKLAELPWQVPPLQRPWFVTQHRLTRPGWEGPALKDIGANSFYVGVSARLIVIGRLPDAESILLTGSYGMHDESHNAAGDGVVRINGQEVLRVGHGPRPFLIQAFSEDISRFAGASVMIEFIMDGEVLGPATADWHNPQIVVQ